MTTRLKFVVAAAGVLAISGCEERADTSNGKNVATAIRPSALPQVKPVTPPAAPGAAATAPGANASVPTIPVGTKLKCPVTNEDFTVTAKTQQIVYQGKSYAFCCADCIPEFQKNPAKYIKQ